MDQTLGTKLLEYCSAVQQMTAPADVLGRLHDITSQSCGINVLGAGRFPVKIGDWSALQLDRSVFVHKSVPKEWWPEYSTLGRRGYDPGIMMARVSLAPYTWTESCKMLEPIGVDRWPYELALKHGMRDGFTCPLGSRWVVAYWAPKVLNTLQQPARALLFMAANFAAIRLEAITTPDPKRVGLYASLTARELAVLRLASLGSRSPHIAEALGLGEETVRSHFKKAQSKLGAQSRVHTVAEAIRQFLIP